MLPAVASATEGMNLGSPGGRKGHRWKGIGKNEAEEIRWQAQLGK